MHAYHELYVHIVWATFMRLPMIEERCSDRLYAIIGAKCEELNCRAMGIGGVEDHVHVLVRMSPAVSVAELSRQMKGVSAHFANRELQLGGILKWQQGYGAFTVGKRSAKRVTEYVLAQKEHHARGTLIGAFESTGGETVTNT